MDFIILGIVILVIAFVVFFPNGECPRCGGRLKKSFYDSEIGRQIYKCEDCGEEYI